MKREKTEEKREKEREREEKGSKHRERDKVFNQNCENEMQIRIHIFNEISYADMKFDSNCYFPNRFLA